MDRDRVEETIRDDLPEADQQHVDEQSAAGLPDDGPGRNKMENLRRIELQRTLQRRRMEASHPEVRD